MLKRKNSIPQGVTFNKSNQKVLFCENVRTFISDSHKCQTLFANCEGSYSRRVASCRERNLLEEIIFNYMFCDDYCNGQLQSNSFKRSRAKAICDRMIPYSKQYIRDDEIHFSVVWVYYYDYKREMLNQTPVFKIFKRKTGSEAVFLDIFLNYYKSWDCYLENAEFVESFLCVPRHGEYCFDNQSNMLVLEYVLPKNLITDVRARLFNAFPSKPFSERVIRPIFTVIKLGKNKIVEKIAQFLRAIPVSKEQIFQAAIFIFLAWTRLKNSSTIALRTISQDALMLWNKVGLTQNWSDLLNPSVLCETNTFGFPKTVVNAVVEISEERTHFFELLSSKEKNWLEIMKSFCNLVRNGLPLLSFTSIIYPSSFIINALSILLHVVDIILSNLNCHERVNTDQNLENKNLGMSSLQLLPTNEPSSSAFDDQCRMLKSTTVDSETQVDVPFKNALCEEVIRNLSSLETASVNAVYNSVLEKSAKFDGQVQPRPTDLALDECKIFVGKQDGYGIYIFTRASVPVLTSHLRRLLKTHFCLIPREDFVVGIYDRFGQSLGFVFFPSEFTAFGLFPLGVIENEESFVDLALEL